MQEDQFKQVWLNRPIEVTIISNNNTKSNFKYSKVQLK